MTLPFLNLFANAALILYDPSAAFYIIDHSIFLDAFFVFEYITFHGFPLITVVASSQLLILHPSSIFKCWSTSRLSPLISSLLYLYSFFFHAVIYFHGLLHVGNTCIDVGNTCIISVELSPDTRFKSNCLLNISIWMSVRYLKVSTPHLSL